jgi:hypothetical protein
MQRLHIVGLDRDEAHGRPTDDFGDRLGIDIVALVRLYVWLGVLGWNDSHLVPLLPEGSAEEVSSGTGLHADQIDLDIRGKLQQLRTRALLANYSFTTQVQANQVEHRLAEINANRAYLHGNTSSVHPLYPS